MMSIAILTERVRCEHHATPVSKTSPTTAAADAEIRLLCSLFAEDIVAVAVAPMYCSPRLLILPSELMIASSFERHELDDYEGLQHDHVPSSRHRASGSWRRTMHIVQPSPSRPCMLVSDS